MTTRNGMCLICAFNSRKLVQASSSTLRRLPRQLLSAPARSFSATSVALRAPVKQSNSRKRAPAPEGNYSPTRHIQPPTADGNFSPSRKLRRAGDDKRPAPKRGTNPPGSKPKFSFGSQDKWHRRPDVKTFEAPRAPPDSELEEHIRRAMVAMVPQTAMLTGSGYLANYLPADANIHDVGRKFQEFRSALLTAFRATDLEAEPTAKVPSKLRIQNTFMKENTFGLKALLEDSFLQFIGSAPPQESEVREASMETAADVRFPQEWFPNTRQFQRTLHLHVGPTNSGKTYHALKRLEESDNGVYAGPLRLLAQEIFERMNAKGLTCNLVTGDDIRVLDETARFQSSTMEMVDVSTNFDVCVIDEIQMIGDENRGWAWTYALMGVRAKEVHMCGEERTVDLIKRLAAALGDELIIHNYKRLGPLEVQAESLQGDLKKIEKGDCIVTFSRRNIFALKRSIEEQTGKRCAVIYGSLPPETRSTQAQLFNDQDSEYDILVASDAVGMGLNLSIKRMIFEATEKWNGKQTVSIKIPDIKQISGRAGRYKVPGAKPAPALKPGQPWTPPTPQVGYVTTLEKTDLKVVRNALRTEVAPIQTAGIMPLPYHIEMFAAQFPSSKPFSEILHEMSQYLRTSKLFHMCSMTEQVESARLFDKIPSLTVADRMTFIIAPIGRDAKTKLAVQKMAEAVAKGEDGSVLANEAIDLEALDVNAQSIEHLQRLEALHKSLIVYLWLSYRFPATFTPRETAQEMKAITEKRIEACLQSVKFMRQTRLTRGRRLANAVAESLDPDAMANLEDEKTEPDEHVANRH